MSDIHCRFGAFAPDTMPPADVCLVAGDLTNTGNRYPSHYEVPQARYWLTELARRYRVLWIPGNHDIGVTAETFADIPDCQCIDGRVVDVCGLRIAGVSLTVCYDVPHFVTTWDYMTDLIEQERKILHTDLLAHGHVDILLSHGPPRGILDNAGYVIGEGERHIGSECLREYIEDKAPRLVVCGHVHAQVGNQHVNRTRVVNTACRWGIVEVEGSCG